MSKSKKKIDTAQMSIFDLIREMNGAGSGAQEGSMGCLARLRGAIRAAIKQSHLSRHQIAGEMSHLTGKSITKEQLDSWTRESDELNGRAVRHIPAEYLPALCRVTGSMEPLRVMCEVAGYFVMPGPEALRAEIQKLDEEIKELRDLKRKRMLFLKEMGR